MHFAATRNLQERQHQRLVPTSVPLLVKHELVRPTEEDFRGQVPAQFATQGTLDGDRLERKLIPPGGHVAAAAFAGHREQSPLDGGEPECHSTSISEIKAKLIHSQSARGKWSITAMPHAREASRN
jgi:hypothetical protein